jgi:ribosomal protein S18 acetylase RimI-like enzyme
MGRLAVDHRHRGRGYGERLIGDAVARCLRAELGVRVLVVDALHEQVAGFYESYGFRRTCTGALTLYLPFGRA